MKKSLLVALVSAAIAAVGINAIVTAQQPGTNVNVLPSYPIGNVSPPFPPPGISQTDSLKGDGYLQRQVEPVVASSTLNPDHLVAAFGDFRTVDIGFDTGVPGAAGEGWLGYSRSYDRGKHWYGAMVPGFPGSSSDADVTSPLHGFTAGSDPVLTTTPGGHFYLGGLFFTRDRLSNIAVMHLRDVPSVDGGDSIQPGKIAIVDKGSNSDDGNFEDKPSIASDIARKTTDPSACGPVYMAYTIFTGGTSGAFTAKVGFSRSKQGKCGEAWDPPQYLNKNYKQNQGTATAVDPTTGRIYVIWRHFSVAGGDGFPDGIVMATSTDFGGSFSSPVMITGPEFAPYDQISVSTAGCSADNNPPCPVTFRSHAFPAIAVDGGGNVYVASQEKVFMAASGKPNYYEPRITIRTLKAGAKTWTKPSLIDLGPNGPGGQQVMPALAFAGGLLKAMWYDFRRPEWAEPTDAAWQRASDSISGGYYIAGLDRRMETRIAQSAMGADANGNPTFGVSAPVTNYLLKKNPNTSKNSVPLINGLPAVNRSNLPMYAQGSTAFTGDYITLMSGSPFVATPGGANPFRWATAPDDYPAMSSLAVWTDTRDAVSPIGNSGEPELNNIIGWATYQPAGTGGASCVNPGSRNQNVYFSEVKPGIIAGSPATSRQLVDGLGRPFERAFPLYVQNPNPTTAANGTIVPRYFRLTFQSDSAANPVKGSFVQGTASATPAGAFTDVGIFPFSSASKTIYVYCPNCTTAKAFAPFSIKVDEIPAIGASTIPSTGLKTIVRFNNDPTAPFVTNTNLGTQEIHTVLVSSPQYSDPQYSDPQYSDPQYSDPQYSDPQYSDPQYSDPQYSDMQPVGDFVWTASNVGNNASAYSALVNVSPSLQQTLGGGSYKYRLIISKTYNRPGFNASCQSQPIPSDQIISIVPLSFGNPQYSDPQYSDPQYSDPQYSDATFASVPPSGGSSAATAFAAAATTALATPVKRSSGDAPIQDDQVFIVLRVYGPQGTSSLSPTEVTQVLSNVSTTVTPQAGDATSDGDGTPVVSPPVPASDKGFSTTTLTSNTASTTYGQSIVFTAHVVQKGTATAITAGVVDFREVNASGATIRLLASAQVNGSGNATTTVSDFDVAGSPHRVNAIFSGTAIFNGSLSNTLSQTVAQAAVTATAGSGSAVYDGATKSPSACQVTGSYTGDLTCANSPASVGPASGTTTIVPVVSGTGLNNYAITLVNGSYAITPVPTSTTLAAVHNPSAVGDPVTFAATISTVSPSTLTPQGQVVFKEGATTLAGPTSTDANGTASFTTSTLALGSHTVTAAFTGAPNFAPSSANLTEAIASYVCYADLPNPTLTFTGTEVYDVDGTYFTRYNLAVTNRSSFPDSLFAASADLPPCGDNTSASRTWVDILDHGNSFIYGFCALGSSSDLAQLWFAEPVGTTPPSPVHITLTDRRCDKVYTSNEVAVAPPSSVLFAATDDEEFASQPNHVSVMKVIGSQITTNDLVATSFPVNGMANGGGFLYGGDPFTNTLRKLKFDGTLISDTTTITGGTEGAWHEDYAFDGTNLYRAHYASEGGQIDKINPANGQILGTYPTGEPIGITLVGSQFWVSRWHAPYDANANPNFDKGDVGTWNPVNNTFTHVFFTPSLAGGLAYDPRNGILWVGRLGGCVEPYNLNGSVLGSGDSGCQGAGYKPFGDIDDTIDGLEIVAPFTSVPVDPQATYLLTNQDPNATSPQGISLSGLNVTPGTKLLLQTSGVVDFCHTDPNCQFNNRPNPILVAAFTAGAVPNASSIIATGLPQFTTQPTLFGGLATDLPNDFRIAPGSGATVTVPAGATTLWVILSDSFYGDNSGSSLSVVVTKVP